MDFLGLSLGLSWTVWDLLGLSAGLSGTLCGTFLGCLGLSLTLWDSLGLSWTVFDSLRLSGTLLGYLGLSFPFFNPGLLSSTHFCCCLLQAFSSQKALHIHCVNLQRLVNRHTFHLKTLEMLLHFQSIRRARVGVETYTKTVFMFSWNTLKFYLCTWSSSILCT